MSKRLAGNVALALLAGSAWMAGCTSTTTTTSTGPAGDTEARTGRPAAADKGDPERRAKVRLELASAYLSRGQFDTALEEARQALAAKPDWPDAHSLLALIYASQGDNRQAEQSFQRALQLSPQDGNLMHNYGWYLCQQRRFADADRQFENALAQPQYRDVPRTLLAAGVCQARDNRMAEAERSLSRAFELEPGNPAVAYNLSDLLYRRGDYERARFYVNRVNAVPDYTNAQSLWLAARIEKRAGNAAGLDDAARKLRDRYPQSPETALLDQGKFDE